MPGAGQTMISAILERPRSFMLREGKIPRVDGDQVLIRVYYCGICGSDLHTFLGHNPFVALPAILGHEMVGEVVATGSDVRRFRIGDRVTYEPTNHCGRCLYCAREQYNLCMNRTPTIGSFREFTVMREDQLHRVPKAVPDQAAVLIEPLASALHALDVCQLERGQRVLVLGSGAIGILLTASSKQRGAEYVAATNRSRPKLRIARRFGADDAIHTPEPDCADLLRKRVGEHRIDTVFDTVATSALIGSALSVLKKGCTLVIVGTPISMVEADFSRILINELHVAGSLKYRGNFPEAIEVLANPSSDYSSLISRTFALKDIQAAFEEVTANSSAYIKCLIRP